MLTLIPVTSSTVKAVGFDGSGLYVSFLSGKVYLYASAPRSVFDQLMAAPSKGKFISSDVKSRFTCSEYTGPFRVASKSGVPLRDLLTRPQYGF